MTSDTIFRDWTISQNLEKPSLWFSFICIFHMSWGCYENLTVFVHEQGVTSESKVKFVHGKGISLSHPVASY